MLKTITKIGGWLFKDKYKLVYTKWENVFRYVFFIGFIIAAIFSFINIEDDNNRGIMLGCALLVVLMEVRAYRRKIKELMLKK